MFESKSEFKEAMFWQKSGERLECLLCPRFCKLKEGQTGYCGARKNIGGTLRSMAYARPTGFAVDPMEKKPLYHFYPATPILSLGTLGCNMGCKFCQNCSTSKRDGSNLQLTTYAPAQEVVALAERQGVKAIAFTYNEPIIWAEYMMDIAALAVKRDIRTVAVTAGYISEEARPAVFENIEAANVDLKGFSRKFYRKLASAELAPVLDALRFIRNKTKIWLEITNLIIPDENDGEDILRDLCKFTANELGCDTPLHFSAFHPAYKMTNRPPTPLKTLERAFEIACEEGLKYVYLGNINSKRGRDTLCPSCGKTIIERDWFYVASNRIKNGACSFCGTSIAGVFSK